jgi:S-adenosylmethionine uptake transporter
MRRATPFSLNVGGVPASLMMVLAAFFFATMGMAVKLASAYYSTAEVVMYRGLTGMLLIAALSRWRGESLRTGVPLMHLTRGLAGVTSLCLWFYAISGLPLATAMTFNYMSSIWMALFLVGGAVLWGSTRAEMRVDPRLVVAILIGFAGVAAILRPTIEREQAWYGLMGLFSGVIAAMAYLQVTALGRVGEPEARVVFYFSTGSAIAGLLLTLATGGLHAHSLRGVLCLLGVGVPATLAQLLLTRAYAIGKPLVNASLQYLGIVFSVAYGAWVFGDRVTPLTLVGIALVVFSGLAAARLRQVAYPQPVPSQPPDLSS